MAGTAIASVASFSVVLAETFAAVGLSTVVPNLFIAAAKAAKGATNAGVPRDQALLARESVDRAITALSGTSPNVGTANTELAAARTQLLDVQPDANTAANAQAAGTFQSMFEGDNNPIKKALDVVKAAASNVDEIHVLLPNKAVIDAEFEFHAAEAYKAEAGLGAAIEMVTVKAGYSAMYEATSRNKVTLHVEFGPVAVKI